MIFLSILYLVSLYVLVIDWAYFHQEHKMAFLFEAVVFVLMLTFTSLYFLHDPDMYSHGGRKIDLITFMWLGRELIHTRVKFNNQRKEITSLVRESAIQNTLHL